MLTLRFYGYVQGMIRLHNAKPSGYQESITLAKLIKTQGCTGCPRLHASRAGTTSYSYPCRGVGWIGLDGGYLYEHQDSAVHATGSELCQLRNRTLQIPDDLIVTD